MDTLLIKSLNIDTATELLFDKEFVYEHLIPYVQFFLDHNLNYLKAIEIELENKDKFVISFTKDNIRPFMIKYKKWLEQIENYEQCNIMKEIFRKLRIF